jgi:hypothetical protein
MKSFVRLAAIAAALALAAPASAQQAQHAPKIGIGIAVTPVDTLLNGLPPVEIYVPIGIAPQFRIEPSIGFFTSDVNGGTDRSDFTLGIGAFFLNPLAPQLDLYAGGRLKLNFASVDNGVTDDSDTDLFLAAAVGGEYYFVPKFSLGLEAQAGLYRAGDVSGDADGFFTSGLAFLRVYF